MSRSSHAPHAGHCQARTYSGFGPSCHPAGRAGAGRWARTGRSGRTPGRTAGPCTPASPRRRTSRPSVTANRALRVNRIACRVSLRDRNRGSPVRRPFRSSVSEAKKFRYAAFRSARACWRTTAETSPRHARCGVALTAGTCRLTMGSSLSGTDSLVSRVIRHRQFLCRAHRRSPTGTRSTRTGTRWTPSRCGPWLTWLPGPTRAIRGRQRNLVGAPA